MSLFDEIMAILAPNDCLGCGIEGRLVCHACLESLEPASIRQYDNRHIASINSVTDYNGLSKDLLWKLKSSGAQEAAKIMADCMVKLLPPNQKPLIVPVPTASSRVRLRGYDQAKLIARQVSKKARLPYLNCLIRSGQAHQVGAGREQRLLQLETAFRVKRSRFFVGKTIVLIDDVVTTGASLEMAAKTLQAAGAKEIYAVTFAQAQLRIK